MRWRLLPLVFAVVLGLCASYAPAQVTCGDLDVDGDVDADDALILRGELSGGAALSLEQALSCDVRTEPREPGLEPDPTDLAGRCSMADSAVMTRTGNSLPPPVQQLCPLGATTDCCAANGGVGCNSDNTVLCVCNLNPACCTVQWTASCAALACTGACTPVCPPGQGYCGGMCRPQQATGGSCTAACDCASGVCGFFYRDLDGDGYGFGPQVHVCGPAPGPGISDNNTDCNDASPAINPGAVELVGDQIDQNCDFRELCFRDQDGDAFRTSATILSSDLDCNDPGEASSSAPTGDCCDTDPNARPGQASYFSTARNGCGGYDYNCNGPEERQDPNLFSIPVCGGSPPSCLALGFGWETLIPACGASGTFRSCSATCGTQSAARTQSCR